MLSCAPFSSVLFGALDGVRAIQKPIATSAFSIDKWKFFWCQSQCSIKIQTYLTNNIEAAPVICFVVKQAGSG